MQKGSLSGYPQLFKPLELKAFPASAAPGDNPSLNIGYARVSTEDQHLDLQLQALEAAGCARIFQDHGRSGAQKDRPGLGKALRAASAGDVLVVWKLDQLGRSLPHLVEVIDGLRRAGIGFRSLQEQIDTTSAGGRFYFHMLAALAELERELISERTKAGMAAAKRNGRHVGRPHKLSAAQVERARRRIAAGEMEITQRDMAKALGVGPETLRRALGRTKCPDAGETFA